MTTTNVVIHTSQATADSVRKTSSAIRVLHVINGEHYSGAERVQDLLSGALPMHDVEVGFACVKPGRFRESRRNRMVPVYETPMRHRLDLRPIRHLTWILREQNYHLIHAHTPRTAVLAALASRLSGIPFVYHVHSPTSRDSTRPFANRLNTWTERFSLRFASALIAVSGSLAWHMKAQGYPDSTIHVVPNGVPRRVPRHRPADFLAEWTLGTVALFRPRKGTDVLIRALAILKERRIPVRLRAVGGFESVEYERTLKNLATQKGVEGMIDWTGFSDDVDAELDRMDLMVLPSLFGEGLPMVVLEAMAAGVPVVATRVEGTPEAIRDRVDGVLAEPNDPEDLARAVEEIVQGRVDYAALRRSALERHAEYFSDQAMARGVADVYRKVLGR